MYIVGLFLMFFMVKFGFSIGYIDVMCSSGMLVVGVCRVRCSMKLLFSE